MSECKQFNGRDIVYDESCKVWRYSDTGEIVESVGLNGAAGFFCSEPIQAVPCKLKNSQSKSWREIFIVLCMICGAFAIGSVIAWVSMDMHSGGTLAKIALCVLLCFFFLKALRGVKWVCVLLMCLMLTGGGCSNAWNKSTVDSKGGDYHKVDAPTTEIDIEWERTEK